MKSITSKAYLSIAILSFLSTAYGVENTFFPNPTLELRSFSAPTNIIMIDFETWSGYRKVESVWINSDSTTNHPSVSIGTYNETNNIFQLIAEMSGPDQSMHYYPSSELILERNEKYYARFEFQSGGAFEWKVWVPHKTVTVLPGFGNEMVSTNGGLTWLTGDQLGYEFSTALLLGQILEVSMNHLETGEFEIYFDGVLQESTNLVDWVDLALPYESPVTIVPDQPMNFYRSRKE